MVASGVHHYLLRLCTSWRLMRSVHCLLALGSTELCMLSALFAERWPPAVALDIEWTLSRSYLQGFAGHL